LRAGRLARLEPSIDRTSALVRQVMRNAPALLSVL
jgi:hypothetical protein